MLKNRWKVWLVILLCTGIVAIVLLTGRWGDFASQYIFTIGKAIFFYVCFCIGAFFLGRQIEKKFGLEEKSAVFLAVVAIALVGLLIIFKQEENSMKKMQEETLPAVEKTAITAEEIGLQSSSDSIADSGENYWKSWLDYTVMLQGGGSLEYNCERFVDTEDAQGRLDDSIKADLLGKEYIEIPIRRDDTGIDRIEAYEWLTGDDTGIRVFYYYFLGDDMILRVKYRDTDGLNDSQLGLLIQWFGES